MAPNSRRFTFDGGAGTYLGTILLAVLVTTVSLGICYPFGVVLVERWRAKHSYIDGRQLVFTGSAIGLFGLWIKWFLLIVVTLGIYSLWVGPRIAQWKWENTDFAAPGVPPAHTGIAAVPLPASSPDSQASFPAPATPPYTTH
jgi:uncharacterized membrane protein YjgN (DUF898 family)